MPTLMNWTNEDGTQGRCDSRCHNARKPECYCRCGGLFHGAGRNGTLNEKLASADRDTLTKMARRPTGRNPALNGLNRRRPPQHSNGRAAGKTSPPLWQQDRPEHWITSWLMDPMGGLHGEIERAEDGTHSLTVTGPSQEDSRHNSLREAMNRYDTLRNLAGARE